MRLSKAQVDKLGKRLRKDDVPSDEDLRLLSGFREDRRAALDAVTTGLLEIGGSVQARRLKTINSIVDKLRRESARLSQVQDIAGVRMVGHMTRAEQDRVVDRIGAHFPGAKVFDRRVAPSHGYRAVHVVVPIDSELVEIQVRTDLQHRWAMLVEGLADAWGQQVKYGGLPDEPESTGPGGRSRAQLAADLEAASFIIDGTERAIDRGEPMQGVPEALRRYLDRLAAAVPQSP